ncbi:MAG TPA: alpha-amylase family glycosyl hydrolase, partial [Anaerolineaceae bacterium]|nr:alpha-amylase family glycosyl hydrolase [Anaerolineaceae bacterium]
MHKLLNLVLVLAIILGLGAGAFDRAAAQAFLRAAIVLDGTRDSGYTLLAQDAVGDLANPGPGSWSGTAWTDLSNLYVADDGTNFWVFIDLPAYSQTGSSGEITLVIDKDGDNSSGGGGTNDPWGSAVSYNYNSLYNNVGQTSQLVGMTVHPDFVVRGNLPGISGNPPDENNGWTELRIWNGSSWNGASSNWGGITAGAQIGSKIAYANNQGLEFKIPWADLGLPAGSMVNLQFYALQKGSTRGAYDTVPSDDQSNGWNDPTSQTKLATFGGSSEPPLAPTNVQATDGSFADKVRITWQISTGTASYDVYRALTADGSKVLLGNATAALMDDTTAVAGTTYYYWVKAKNAGGESDFSTADSGYRNISQPLDAPVSVQASDGTFTDKVAVTWGMVNEATSYDVYRSDILGGSKTLLGNTTTISYNDITGAANVPYYYWVKAKNASSESDFSVADSGYRNSPNPTSCEGAESGDGTISTAEIFHDSTLLDYRNPLGNIAPDGTATLRLRVCHNDVQQVKVWVWKTGDPLATPSNKYLAAVGSIADGYDYWEISVPGPGSVTDQWYQFEITDGARSGFYRVAGTNNTGPGVWNDIQVDRSWKLGTSSGGGTGDYYVPDWMKDAVIYQIFPDRFRNGNTANDILLTNHLVYGPTTCGGTTCQPYLTSWNNFVVQDPNYGIEFKGGDLEGVTQKINAGYFDDLGINVIYLNPVFDASSNHGYDT